jgi:hypothetical protein
MRTRVPQMAPGDTTVGSTPETGEIILSLPFVKADAQEQPLGVLAVSGQGECNARQCSLRKQLSSFTESGRKTSSTSTQQMIPEKVTERALLRPTHQVGLINIRYTRLLDQVYAPTRADDTLMTQSSESGRPTSC